MKLYTEEQVKYFFECGRNFQMNGEITFSMAQKEITPIELPSDQEIEEYVDSTPYCGHCTFEFKEGVEYGAKWVIEQIKQQDK